MLGTVAGRAFSTTTIVETPDEPSGGRRIWLPLIDGTVRIGAMRMSFPDAKDLPEATVTLCERYAHLVAMIIATKDFYDDAFESARRRKPMTIASELLWQLTPRWRSRPMTLLSAACSSPATTTAATRSTTPPNDAILQAAVFDAMGHGLPAAGAAAFAVSAYRHSRRGGHELVETYAAMNAAVAAQPGIASSRLSSPNSKSRRAASAG